MNITDLLAATGGLDSLARELGIDPQQAASGAAALAPAIVNGFQKHEDGSGGGLTDLLGKLGGGGLMDQVLVPGATDTGAGNTVLGHIFGSKDVSRAVADQASTQSGLAPELLKKMLPLLAMLVGGLLAKGGTGATGASGGLGGVLGGLFGGSDAGGVGAVLGRLGGMLRANGGANALDDVLRSLGKGTS
jgi:hypothetical protein